MEEDRRLNFNRPFLSVRRNFPPASPSSEPVERSRKTDQAPPKIPKLPPNRSELKSGPLREPGTVPFTWEQSPGRPKHEGAPKNGTHQRPPVAPKLPPGRSTNPKQTKQVKPSNDDGSKDVRPEIDHGARDNLEAEHEKPDNESKKDGEEIFYDAQDELSRSDSFFYNCSVSGLIGSDGRDLGSPGTDPGVQEFMMGRFLPAAKAMASETPPHSHNPKKQQPPVVPREQPKLRVKKAPDGNPLLRYNSSFLSRYMGQTMTSGFESEEEDGNEPENSSVKVCGLLPRFLLKGSLCSFDSEQDMVKLSPKKKPGKSKPSRFGRQRDYPNTGISEQGKHSPGNENGCTSFRDLLANEGDEWKSSSWTRGPVVERTLYVDSVRTGNNLNSRSSDASSVSGPPSYRGIEFDVCAVNDKVKEEIKEIDFVVDEKEIAGIVDSVSVSSLPDRKSNSAERDSPADSSNHEIKHIVLVEEKDISGLKSVEPIELKLSEPGKSPCNGKVDADSQRTTRTSGQGNKTRPPPGSTFHIPPMLPKSPAESWLLRTLPTVPSRNSPARFSPSSYETDRSRLAPVSPSVDHNTNIRTSRPPSVVINSLDPSVELLEPIPEL